MTQAALSEKEQKAAATKARSEDMDKREAALNADKTGVGLRTFLGMTRGKNPTEIKYDGFDEAQVDTLPKTIASTLEVLKLDPSKDEADIVNLLIKGFNDVAYTAASDPLSEFVDTAWPSDAQAQFRIAVRNYSRGVNVSIEEAVNLIKPGFDKQYGPKA